MVLNIYRNIGKTKAEALQNEQANMSGTEINAQDNFIPDFRIAIENSNMLNRKAGQDDGFICRSSQGRIVRLIQNYDSDIYKEEPEELLSQWRFVWSQDPQKALPFMSFATSPYAKDDCCTYEGHVWKSGQDGNIWEPGSVGVLWTDLGTIEDIMDNVATNPDEPSTEPPETTTYPDYVKPSGSHDAYQTGDIVNYNGTLYKSKIDDNVWTPDEYPNAWEIYVT